MDKVGQLVLVLAVFAGVLVWAWRRGREDPVERLWIPIAVAILPMAIAWVLTKHDEGALETAFLVWAVAMYAVAWCVAAWWEYPRVGSHGAEFREAVVISAAAAVFALTWFWGAGSQAAGLAIPIFTLPSTLAWARYQHVKRSGQG